MNPATTQPNRNKALAPILFLALQVCTIAAYGASISFTAAVSGELRTATLDTYDVQGVAYISLPALMRRLGGGSRVLPARVQADLAGNSAIIGINDTRVTASQNQFSLRYPIVAYEGGALMAAADAPLFFVQAFQIALRETGQLEAATPASTAAFQPDVVSVEMQEPLEPTPTQAAPTAAAPVVPPGGEIAPAERAAIQEGEAMAPGAIRVVDLETPTTPAATPMEPSTPGAIDVIIIDAGHGGNDTGYAGPTGLVEKDLTLTAALCLRRALKESTSAKIFLTREEDREVTLKERANFANQKHGGLLISLHAGASFSPRAHGFEIFYPARGANLEAVEAHRGWNRELGQEARDYAAESLYIGKAVAQALASMNSAEPRGVHEVPLRLFGEVAMPGILIEIGFLTNPAEEALLQTENYQTKLAEGIAAGLANAMEQGTVAGGVP